MEETVSPKFKLFPSAKAEDLLRAGNLELFLTNVNRMLDVVEDTCLTTKVLHETGRLKLLSESIQDELKTYLDYYHGKIPPVVFEVTIARTDEVVSVFIDVFSSSFSLRDYVFNASSIYQ
jgi:hypothetical protein